jgi:hypothetical protein
MSFLLIGVSGALLRIAKQEAESRRNEPTDQVAPGRG